MAVSYYRNNVMANNDSDPKFTMPSANSSMFTLIQHLLTELFIAEKRRLDKSVAALIRQNNELSGVQAAGFLYYGEYYTAEGFRTFSAGNKITLHDSLTDKIKWHLKDAKTVADDERLIGQVIFRLIGPCETLQDMRDSLPDCLAAMIPELAKRPRHNQQGWSLRQDTRGSRQFEKILPKIEMYSAARLLY
jgi:hypothetical protein